MTNNTIKTTAYNAKDTTNTTTCNLIKNITFDNEQPLYVIRLCKVTELNVYEVLSNLEYYYLDLMEYYHEL